MKTIIFSFSVVALMLFSSVLTAQEISTASNVIYDSGAGCSSCGQQSFGQQAFVEQSFEQQSFVAPVSYNQPIVAVTPTFAQPVTAGCSSCGTSNVSNFAAPVETSYVSQPAACSSCGQATRVASSTNACCCSNSGRAGFLRGGRRGGLGGQASSRLIRTGIMQSIDN